ncbi:MAG: ATP-binding protein [Methanosarcinaceae archaeon]|nr:ATP-binding protein [Methanosarcinaceae archaeon]
MKVLVVDDNINARKLLVKMLVANNYEASEAINGKEALKFLKTSKPDLIISDIMMPEMDGFIFIREVKKNPETKDIPFVFYTAHYVSEKDHLLATALGASRFIVKPVEPRELINEIQNVLNEYEAGLIKPVEPIVQTEEEYLTKYSERVVTKLEEKYSELEKTKNFLDAVLSNMDDCVIVVDPQLNVTYYNNKVTEVAGSDVKLGEKLPHIIFPYETIDLKIVSHETFETTITNKEGKIIYFEGIVSPTIKESGESTGYILVFRDVTQRKRNEAEILEKNRELSTLYSVATIAAESFDRKELLQVILREMTAFIGVACGSAYLIDENTGEANLWAHQGLSADFVEKVRCLPIDDPSVVAVLESKKPFVSQEPLLCNKHITSTEKEHNIKNVIIFSLRSHEKVIGFVNLTIPFDREISDDDMRVMESVGNEVGIAVENVRLFEETKKAYDELKLLDEMKNEFLSNVSHELKTPLVSIKGYSELMCDESLGALNEKQKKAMEVVSRNSERLRHLIDSLIYLTIEKAKKIEFRFNLIQIVDVINQAVSDVHPMIEKKGLTIITDMPDELPKVNGDTDRLTEVIINLIDNAVKFTPKGGEITIAACEEPEMIHITVKDTGVGIPKDAISKLFKRFYQVDASTTRRYGGTGLGLYITKSIVKMHNGQIWVESEEGVGTTFHILLPKICSTSLDE